ncbi:hypothetical protein EG328_011997 [Venturia inaequalis]|uniref:BTB domain-containing protein n=1 Tax=Venturia inaequalis TaxID=5025 RepID=A0A8H3Z5X7_VENIN|nr:hypothetical protein EG328_011997 [Venturia inaequalis]
MPYDEPRDSSLMQWAEGFTTGLKAQVTHIRSKYIADHIFRYLDDQKLTDLTVIYNGQKHEHHKIILCSQSGFFAKALNNFKEAATNIVELHHDNPEVLDAMFSYLGSCGYQYQARLLEATENWEDNVRNLVHEELYFHAEVYAAADFFDIPALKKLAAKQFRRAVDPIRDPLPIKLIVYINETTPENDRGLRDITVEWYLCRMPRVIFMEGDSIGKATVQVPAFASDVLTLIESKAIVCAYCMDLSTDGWGSRCSCPKRVVPDVIDWAQ